MAIIRKLKPAPGPEPTLKYRLKRLKNVQRTHDDSNWLISYADMMTLLCIFYIVLFSMSKINTAEFEKVKKQVSEHFGSKYESPTEDLGKFVNNILIETGVEKEATLSSDGVSVSIAFHSTLFFDTLSAEISEPGKKVLEKIILGLDRQQKKSEKKYKIVVEGHTDSQSIIGGPYPSNWELSSARSSRVVRLFLDHGFTADHLVPIGYADTLPEALSRNSDGTWNEAGLAKNRRVVLRVLMPEVDSIPWQRTPAQAPVPASAPAKK